MPGALLQVEDKRMSKTQSLPLRASTECTEAGAETENHPRWTKY